MRDKKYKLTLSDIWYYYKIHFFVVLAIIIAIVYTVYTSVTRVEPDFTIDCLSDSGITYEDADELGILLGDSGKVSDNDGDGQVYVKVSNYPTGLSSPTGDPNYVQVIQLRMAVGETPIILAEPKVFEMYDDSGVFTDITHIADDCAIADEDRILHNGAVIGIKIDNCALFEQNGFASKDLYLSLRTPTAAISKNDELLKSFDNADAVAKYIIKGN